MHAGDALYFSIMLRWCGQPGNLLVNLTDNCTVLLNDVTMMMVP